MRHKQRASEISRSPLNISIGIFCVQEFQGSWTVTRGLDLIRSVAITPFGRKIEHLSCEGHRCGVSETKYIIKTKRRVYHFPAVGRQTGSE